MIVVLLLPVPHLLDQPQAVLPRSTRFLGCQDQPQEVQDFLHLLIRLMCPKSTGMLTLKP